MSKDVIEIRIEDVEVLDASEYSADVEAHFTDVPTVAEPLVREAKAALIKIEKKLYSAPAFINVVKSAIPEISLQAVLNDEQKKKLAKGTLKLMTKKDGTLMANLIDPKTKKVVKTVSLKSVKMTPEMTQALTSFSIQMQMAQIAEQMQMVQIAVEEVRCGQEYNRLATAYSCQQKLLQAMEIRNPELKMVALMSIAQDAEDSRNLLMLSQKSNVNFLANEPENMIKKILVGATPDKIDSRVNEIRESLYAVNMVSLVEAMAYQQMGEPEAAKKSLEYYSTYMQSTYLSEPGLVKRLDLIDPSPHNYWSKILPEIKRKIEMLSDMEQQQSLGDGKNEEKREK